MKGILKKTERNGWLVRYNKCCVDGQSCDGAETICKPETIILPLHPETWIWLENEPAPEFIRQIFNHKDEIEVDFEFFEAPIFGSSGLIDDVDSVIFAKLKTT